MCDLNLNETKEMDRMENLDVEMRIILEYILNK
jgi:hypothetical protein